MAEFALGLALTFAVLTGIRVLFVPLALLFELLAWRRERRGDRGLLPADPTESPLVTVVVPGYNEERVLTACVESILGCGYPNLDVILVDDGSTDNTAALARSLAEGRREVRAYTKPNGGKGSALNFGIERARGEIVLLVDADGVFDRDTIPEMLRAFRNPKVGAVCGSDRPVNLDRVQTRFLALISHVGTGLVRRALHLLRCLPVVSGNVGAFRRTALQEVAVPGMGPLRTDTLGEDLELTWRLHRTGYQVAFAPRAVVHAESPSTVKGLWKQRVRWSRGLLQALRLHRDMIGNLRYGMFGLMLAYTVVAGLAMPVIQVVGTLALPLLWLGGVYTPPMNLLEVAAETGLALAVVLVLVALALDRTPRDLRHAWTLPIWPFYSLMMSATLLRGVLHELANSPNAWNKLERTGVVSIAVPTTAPASLAIEPHPTPRAASDEEIPQFAVGRPRRGLLPDAERVHA